MGEGVDVDTGPLGPCVDHDGVRLLLLAGRRGAFARTSVGQVLGRVSWEFVARDDSGFRVVLDPDSVKLISLGQLHLIPSPSSSSSRPKVKDEEQEHRRDSGDPLRGQHPQRVRRARPVAPGTPIQRIGGVAHLLVELVVVGGWGEGVGVGVVGVEGERVRVIRVGLVGRVGARAHPLRSWGP